MPPTVNRFIRTALSVGAVCLSAFVARGQTAGSLDPTFADPMVQAAAQVNQVAVQTDGKILAVGDFTGVDGSAINGVVRLNTDGTLDSTFKCNVVATAADQGVTGLTVQADGKIVIVGQFSSVDGTSLNSIARVNVDGSLDPTFAASVDGLVFRVVSQADGSMYIGGSFTTVDGKQRIDIARLMADGTLDTTFDPGTGPASNGDDDFEGIFGVAVQSDGKVLISGEFNVFDGAPSSSVLRLNTDGTRDGSFAFSGSIGIAITIVPEADGHVLVGGIFEDANDDNVGLLRLTSTGAVDPDFKGSSNGFIASLALQSDGKILVGGEFDMADALPRTGVVRLNADGTLDDSLSVGGAPSMDASQFILVFYVLPQANGEILATGSFTAIGGAARTSVALLKSDGSADPSFNSLFGATASISDLAVQSDDKVVAVGEFSLANGMSREGVLRLNTDGSVDGTFNPNDGLFDDGEGSGSQASSLFVQSDGHILIAGKFDSFNNVKRTHVARLAADGTLDTSFDPGTGPDRSLTSVSGEADGKVVIGGSFQNVDGTPRAGVARLSFDGTLDPTFNPGAGLNDAVNSVAVQTDNKVIVGGNFTTANNAAHVRAVRFNTDGSVDSGFNASADAAVRKVLLQPDGKILLLGDFTMVDGMPASQVARLNDDGNLDSGFAVHTFMGSVNAIALGSDGKVALTGSFTSIDGTPRNNAARLNADGTLDAAFDPGAGPDVAPTAVGVESNGNVIIGGGFASIAGVARGGLARLVGAPPPTVTVTSSGEAVEGGAAGKFFLVRSGTDFSQDLTVAFKLRGSAVDGVDYKEVAETAVIPSGQSKVKLKIKAIDDSAMNGTRTVKLKLSASPTNAYVVGTKKATISIVDND